MTELYKIQIPIYKDTLFIFFGTVEECQKALIKVGMCEDETQIFKPSETTQGYFCYFEKDGVYLIWMPVMPEQIAQYGVLVHEIFHFVCRFLSERGLVMNDSSEEAYTYLAEYVYDEIDNYVVTERNREEKRVAKSKKYNRYENKKRCTAKAV